MSTSVGGACVCGAVAFSIAPPYRWFAHCHCSMCRKHHGSLFQTSLGVARPAFQWRKGADEIVHYRATSAFERPFCRRCGSTVPALAQDDEHWNVPAGLLDEDPGARPRSHIFAASRSPLTEIADGLPQHATYPGAAQPAAETAREYEPSVAVSGSCLCGGVTFAATAAPRCLVNCYCSLCRRSRAAAFSSTLPVPSDAFGWTKGSERVRHYALAAPRQFATDFCADCGSLVPSVAMGTAMLPAGAIDTRLAPLPVVHIYVGSKAPWYEIAGAAPQFAEGPPPERLAELIQ
jgi:hypothetical protein